MKTFITMKENTKALELWWDGKWEESRDYIESCIMQPERLSPEDHIEDKLEMVCDSLNTTNK